MDAIIFELIKVYEIKYFLMKVLWFSPTPSLAREYIGNEFHSGGWIESFHKEIIKFNNIELAVAFWNYRTFNNSKFEYKNTVFYQLSGKKGKIKNLYQNHFGISKKDIEIKVKKYLKIIADFKPDIIQIFGAESDFGLIIDKVNIPVIIYMQGILDNCKINFLKGIDKKYYFKKTLREIIMGGGFKKNLKNIYITAEQEEQILSKCNYVVGRTDFDRLMSYFYNKNIKYYHCDEIMREAFYSNEWHFNYSNTLKIISTISGSVYKGVKSIFEAITLIKLNFNVNLEWNIIGLKEDDSVIKLLKKMKIITDQNNKYVNYLGQNDENSMIKKMLEANLFVLPSNIDNSPNSLIEAMLLGMPIITTYAGGIPSLIENNKDGILIQDNDPYLLSAAILELYNNNEKAIKLGYNARIKALKRNDPIKISEQILKLYNDILTSYNK